MKKVVEGDKGWHNNDDNDNMMVCDDFDYDDGSVPQEESSSCLGG